MSKLYRGEMQDNLGNTIYPHTEAGLVFCADGETVQQKIAGTAETLNGITGVSDSTELDDSTKLATSKAVKTLKDSVNSSLGGLKFGTDGDGNYGYYGADGSLIPFNGKKQSKTVSFTTTSSDKNNGYKNVVVTFDDLIKVQSYTIDNFVDNFRIASIINGTVSGNTVNLKIRTADDGRDVSCTITAYGS